MSDEPTGERDDVDAAAQLAAKDDEIARLQAQLDEAQAARRADPPSTPPPASSTTTRRREGYVELNAGDHCPRCQVGVLHLIAEAENSVTLKCFNCGIQGSHDPRVGHQVVTLTPRQTPTGFTLSRAQHAAMHSTDPEEAAAEAMEPEAGSGVTARTQEFPDA